MIITEKKPIDTVLAALQGRKKVAVLGCGRCATTCQTGGEKEVAEMGRLLESKGFKVAHSGVVEAQCDLRLARLGLKKIGDSQAIVSMACGSGGNALAELTNLPVIPTNDTMFLGVVKRLGEYVERCSMCGDCILEETMGVCVKTRCAKGLLNGPCGGSNKGKCEVDGDRDCAWALVIERMRKAGRLKELKKIKKGKGRKR
jgi:hypothetical protein